MLGVLVYPYGTARGLGAAENKQEAERAFRGELPANVAEMRDAILAAAKSGRIEELRPVIEWNELKPDFGLEAGLDPIEHWKRTSVDGRGLEVLALLVTLLEMPPHRLAIGPDAENAGIFVWPYMAELPAESFSPAEEVDALRLMPADAFGKVKAKRTWSWWRLAITADGTWLTFRKYD